MDKESKRFLSYLKEMYEDVAHDVNTKSLTFTGVKAYINHIPRERRQEINEDWDNEIYVLSDKFLLMLYDYSKKMGYVSENMSLEEFTRL